MTRRRSPAQRLAEQTTALALAAPQVVAHRVGRMMTAGPMPSARDQAEFQRMTSEKVLAFNQSWAAMMLQGSAAMTQAWMKMCLQPGQAMKWPSAATVNPWLNVLNAGMNPVRSKAVANAKRLGRTGR
ncbi:polyhydroxyalkanoate granule-associated phasin [Amphibiibacter pelophylacis]|uniref:Uncharacterized protein n=1 Tax=Amphibiibacter pelophylacis TaxID=1799477 RepID=A0ACC6P3Q7_9BURK